MFDLVDVFSIDIFPKRTKLSTRNGYHLNLLGETVSTGTKRVIYEMCLTQLRSTHPV